MGVILLAGVAAFALTLQVSLTGVFRSARPSLALTMSPFDAGARSRLAGQLLGPGQPEESKARARELALDAIRRDPIQPAALRVLAQALPTNDRDSQLSALALMSHSQWLSRRDLMAQTWFVDYHGRRGDPEAVVRHLDLALRTSPSSWARLFPLLVAAASDPQTRPIILRTLSNRPNWAIPFAAYAIEGGDDLDLSMQVARLLLDPGRPDDKARYVILLQRLAAGGRFAQAWAIYNDPALGLGTPGAMTVRNGGFETAEDRTPFDWSYAQEPELWASRERLSDSGGDWALRLNAYNGRSGDVAWQVLHLSPGSYRLSARAGDVPADRAERPQLRIDCESGHRESPLLELSPDAAGVGPHILAGGFAVPADCAFQRIILYLAGDGPLKQSAPWLDDIRIER